MARERKHPEPGRPIDRERQDLLGCCWMPQLWEDQHVLVHPPRCRSSDPEPELRNCWQQAERHSSVRSFVQGRVCSPLDHRAYRERNCSSQHGNWCYGLHPNWFRYYFQCYFYSLYSFFQFYFQYFSYFSSIESSLCLWIFLWLFRLFWYYLWLSFWLWPRSLFELFLWGAWLTC